MTDQAVLAQKYLDQRERKKAYNKKYYLTKTKVKNQEDSDFRTKYNNLCSLLNDQQELLRENERLKQENEILLADIEAFKIALKTSRDRYYELMMYKSDEILPKLDE